MGNLKTTSVLVVGLITAMLFVPVGGAKPLDEALAVSPLCPGVPVATGGHPNGSSWVLYIGPIQPDVGKSSSEDIPVDMWALWASWQLGASTLNNGADGYVFGVTAATPQGDIAREVHGPLFQAGCMEVGQFNGPLPSLFSYTVEGGTFGKSGSEACSWEVSVEIMVGLKFTGWVVTGGEVSFALGGSYGCTDTTVFDTEVIFGQMGQVPL